MSRKAIFITVALVLLLVTIGAVYLKQSKAKPEDFSAE